MFDTILGLPVHALVIHAVVVLVPLCAIATVVMVFSPLWRERLRWPVLGLLFVSGGSVFVAKESGEQLERRVRVPGNSTQTQLIDRHVTLGTQAFWVVSVFCLVVIVWLLLDWRLKGAAPTTGLRILGYVCVVASVAALGWVIWAGHAGSTAVWQQTIQFTNPK